MTDRATAYVRKVHCAVVGTASGGSVQSQTLSLYGDANNAAEALSVECVRNTGYTVRSVRTKVGHFRRIFDREGGIAHQTVLV